MSAGYYRIGYQKFLRRQQRASVEGLGLLAKLIYEKPLPIAEMVLQYKK